MQRKLRDGWSTLRLLYQVDRSAFVIGTGTSVIQSLVYPLILLILWKGFSLLISNNAEAHDLTHSGLLLLGALFGVLALQSALQIVNETAASILKAESTQHVNTRIMSKLAEVPYRMFEDNSFQARYGLVISQASYRPGQLVQSLVSSITALGASVAVAVTIFALAPLLDVFLLALVPLSMLESRYHARVIGLQTTSAPLLFRMMYLSQKSVDATWQRDIRVHRSSVLEDEYRVLAGKYLSNLSRLLRRYQAIRIVVGVGAAAMLTLALAAVFWHTEQSTRGLAEAALLLPALIMGLTQGRSFALSWGMLTECLGYLAQVYDFLDQRFDTAEQTTPRAASVARLRPAPAH